MFIKKCLILLCVLYMANFSNVECQPLYQEKSTLTGDEIRQFSNAEKKYPNFHYSLDVIRYYENDAKSLKKTKKLTFIEMVFKEKDGLYFDEYIGYNATYDPVSKIAHYSFDAGTSSRGEGIVIFCGDKTYNAEWNCGSSNCKLDVWDDVKLLKMNP